MYTLTEIADFLAAQLRTDRYPDAERGGIYRPANQSVVRMGLSLEPFPGLNAWIEEARLDALWLHRPWQLDCATLPPGLGVLSHHLPFDELLTVGFNPHLAMLLSALTHPQPIGFKAISDSSLPARPIGMLIDVPECEFDAQLLTINSTFGGYDHADSGCSGVVSRIAVVGAMTEALVREAASRGAHLYLTGQYRKSAQEAVAETGIAVITTGHRRAETWGMRAMANLLHERWPDLSVLIQT